MEYINLIRNMRAIHSGRMDKPLLSRIRNIRIDKIFDVRNIL